jgi:hypothetical protein
VPTAVTVGVKVLAPALIAPGTEELHVYEKFGPALLPVALICTEEVTQFNSLGGATTAVGLVIF